MTPTERIEAISKRFHKRRNTAPKSRRSRNHLELARKARLSERRARLKAELPEWSRLIRALGGNVAQISRRMGYDRETAERAIWDLGLWPELVKERNSRNG